MGDYGRMTALPECVDQAASTGILAKLSAEQRSVLLSSGHLSEVAAGQILYLAEDRPRFVALIVEGFLRVFIGGSSGRESTIRYLRRGDLLGVVAALSGPSATSVQTLRDSRIWMVDSAALRRQAQTDIQIAWFIAEECAQRVAALVNEIAGSVFATVRQRIAHHLLHMAQGRTSAPYLVARITQTDLANAAGTVREVSVRELRALRAEGLIRPGREGIAILDPDGLQNIAAEAFRPGYGT
ncbi:MAG TPA: Crp/Fnr family transcriptional regulator [Bryobacteraceae bacterium]|jgi:CRP/FNR family transcriptional regulator